MKFQVLRQYITKRHRPKRLRLGMRLNMNEYGPWQAEEIIEAPTQIAAWEKVERKKNCSTLLDPIPETK